VKTVRPTGSTVDYTITIYGVDVLYSGRSVTDEMNSYCELNTTVSFLNTIDTATTTPQQVALQIGKDLPEELTAFATALRADEISRYPLYSGPIAVTGALAVSGYPDNRLRLYGYLQGLEPSASGGIVIYESYSCRDTTTAYFGPGGTSNPWTTPYDSDEFGNAQVNIIVENMPLSSLAGRTLIVRSSVGSFVGCSNLALESPGILPLLAVSALVKAEGYTGSLQPEGDLQIEVVNGTTANLRGEITGMEPSSFGAIVMREGSSCSELGGWLNSPITGEGNISQRFPTSNAGEAEVSALGEGFPISSLLGRVMVVEDAQGTVLACAVTPSEAPSPLSTVVVTNVEVETKSETNPQFSTYDMIYNTTAKVYGNNTKNCLAWQQALTSPDSSQLLEAFTSETESIRAATVIESTVATSNSSEPSPPPVVSPAPTPSPTSAATLAPTSAPTPAPTAAATPSPTSPTPAPTLAATASPTPTPFPSTAPTPTPLPPPDCIRNNMTIEYNLVLEVDADDNEPIEQIVLGVFRDLPDETTAFAMSLPVSEMAPYPGYQGDIAVKSDPKHVGVTGYPDNTLRLYGMLTGLQPLATGAIALHEGYTCENAGPAYTSPITNANPWEDVTYTSDMFGSAEFNVAVEGVPLSSVVGRTVVVEDSDGTEIACAVIGYKSSGVPNTVGVAPLEPFPAYSGPFQPSGKVNIIVNGTNINLKGNLTGMPPSSFALVAMHQGPSCMDTGPQLHSPITDENPWGFLQTLFTDSAGNGIVDVSADGFPLSSVLDRTVVVMDSAGNRWACAPTNSTALVPPPKVTMGTSDLKMLGPVSDSKVGYQLITNASACLESEEQVDSWTASFTDDPERLEVFLGGSDDFADSTVMSASVDRVLVGLEELPIATPPSTSSPTPTPKPTGSQGPTAPPTAMPTPTPTPATPPSPSPTMAPGGPTATPSPTTPSPNPSPTTSGSTPPVSPRPTPFPSPAPTPAGTPSPTPALTTRTPASTPGSAPSFTPTPTPSTQPTPAPTPSMTPSGYPSCTCPLLFTSTFQFLEPQQAPPVGFLTLKDQISNAISSYSDALAASMGAALCLPSV